MTNRWSQKPARISHLYIKVFEGTRYEIHLPTHIPIVWPISLDKGIETSVFEHLRLTPEIWQLEAEVWPSDVLWTLN